MNYLNNFTPADYRFNLAQEFLVVTDIQPKCWNFLTLIVMTTSHSRNVANLDAIKHALSSTRLAAAMPLF
jgi:hypothetical protein